MAKAKNMHGKLTWARVEKMRRLRRTGCTQPELARMFEVSQMTVWRILRGFAWRVQ